MAHDSCPDSSGIPTPADGLLAAVLDSSQEAIVSTTPAGEVRSWNRAAERMFGYTCDEIVGQPVLTLVPADRLEEARELLRRGQAGERIEHFETVRRTRDGRLVDVEITVSPLAGADGGTAGTVSITRDVTEQNRTHRADLLLAAIVNSSDDAIVSKNLDGIITSWNEGAQRIFGYTPAEIIGQPVLKLIPPDRQAEEAAILQRLRRGERVDHFETIRVRKSGEHFPVSLTISPVKNPIGGIVGASKIARDITEMKRISAERDQLLESERAARALAENANRLKDEFLATVSHELRTPLNAIVGWTEVLSIAGTDPAEVAHGVQVIQRNALMQARLVDDLLDLSRITSGKMTLDIGPVDLRQIITEALASVEHSVQAKQLALKTVIGDTRGLLGDAKRLQQVVWNLLTNAIKFTPNRGRIVVSAARVNSHIEIIVSDSGRGIAADFLPHLFERFRQADASTTRTHGGLGIGLALVKQLVELHGGTVRAKSPGENLGATFTIHLPVAALHHEPVPAPAPQAPVSECVLPRLENIRVLAVDDDQDSLAVIRRILAGRGAVVETAASVEEALEKVVQFKPDVLLSDIGMPGQDGYEFIRRVRALPEGASIPAAALTALARAEDRTRALTAGFQNHVSKPVASAEIVAAVHSLASMRRR